MPTQDTQEYIENDYGASIWLNFDFELIEDKININNIKETEIKKDKTTKYYEYENEGATETGYSRNYNLDDIETRIKINELVQAVKQLNNKISSI